MTVQHARSVKSARAALLARLGSGELSLRKVIKLPPVELREAEVYYVCIAARGLGRTGTRTVFERAGVWPHLIMDELTTAQRAQLIRELPARVR